MKIYLDTSSLFKLYQKEPDSVVVEDAFKNLKITEVLSQKSRKWNLYQPFLKK